MCSPRMSAHCAPQTRGEGLRIVSRDWEGDFRKWAQSPSNTEQQRCENGVNAVRNAIDKSSALKHRRITVFTQGSYRNRVNVRKDSDVDIGVLCDETFFDSYPAGKTRADFGNTPATYSYSQFKGELGQALVNYFGIAAVERRNKAFGVHETSYHVEADVVPFFERREYIISGVSRCGVSLVPDSGGRIDNYPERLLDTWPHTPLHYENGVAKNDATSRAFKGVVRILKTLSNEMAEAGVPAAIGIPGFLIECLVWNAADLHFKHGSWDATVRAVISATWSATKEDGKCGTWTEVDGVKYLFHSSQKWTRAQAHAFMFAAWSYVGFR